MDGTEPKELVKEDSEKSSGNIFADLDTRNLIPQHFGRRPVAISRGYTRVSQSHLYRITEPL